jgi:hypothetical protein
LALSAKGVRRASRLCVSCPHDLFPTQSRVRPQRAGNRSGALLAIGRDDQVHLDTLTGITGQHWSNCRLIVRVRQEHGQSFRRGAGRGLLRRRRRSTFGINSDSSVGTTTVMS